MYAFCVRYARFCAGYLRRHHLGALALVLATAGTSYAAATLPKNSVGTPQLRNNAVVSAKVRDGSLRARDFAAGQLHAGPQGPAGLQGPQGPQGPKGDPGQPVLPKIANVHDSATISADTVDSVTVSCPSSMFLVGGGGQIDGDQTGDAYVVDAQPNGADGMTINFANFTGEDQTATAFASCIPASSVSS